MQNWISLRLTDEDFVSIFELNSIETHKTKNFLSAQSIQDAYLCAKIFRGGIALIKSKCFVKRRFVALNLGAYSIPFIIYIELIIDCIATSISPVSQSPWCVHHGFIDASLSLVRSLLFGRYLKCVMLCFTVVG